MQGEAMSLRLSPRQARKLGIDLGKSTAKYGNVRTEVDGVTFHSKREAKRYEELELMQKAGEIRELKLQPPYTFYIRGIKICKYVADFSYREIKKNGDRLLIIEDVKGHRTREYIIKRNLMKALYGIEVRET